MCVVELNKANMTNAINIFFFAIKLIERLLVFAFVVVNSSNEFFSCFRFLMIQYHMLAAKHSRIRTIEMSIAATDC